MERKLSRKNWVYLARLSSFLEVLKNAVPFATVTGSCQKSQADVLAEWKAPKVSVRKLFFGHYVFSNSYELTFILVGQFCKCGEKIDINNFHQYFKPLKFSSSIITDHRLNRNS